MNMTLQEKADWLYAYAAMLDGEPIEFRSSLTGQSISAPQSPVEEPQPPSKGDTAETTVPIRSGPCRVLWLSHDWTGPRGQCGRCGQERG